MENTRVSKITIALGLAAIIVYAVIVGYSLTATKEAPPVAPPAPPPVLVAPTPDFTMPIKNLFPYEPPLSPIDDALPLPTQRELLGTDLILIGTAAVPTNPRPRRHK